MLVKAFGQEAGERRRFTAMTEDLRALEVRQNLIGQWFGMLMSTLQTAGPALMILFGGWLVITGRATVGTVFVFATVLGQRLAGAVTTLASMHVNFTGSLAACLTLPGEGDCAIAGHGDYPEPRQPGTCQERMGWYGHSGTGR